MRSPLEHSTPRVTLRFTLNGEERALEAPPLRRLLDLLREELGLTGTKEGCGEGECGACTVLLDGEAVLACLVPAVHVDGRELRTIESAGLEDLQEAFLAHAGAQCGICTPGFVLAAHAWLEGCARRPRGELAPLDDPACREALAGNLCRCTGYQAIVRSVLAAARERGLPVHDEGGERARTSP